MLEAQDVLQQLSQSTCAMLPAAVVTCICARMCNRSFMIAPILRPPSLDVQASVQQQQQHSPGIMSVRSSSGGLPVQRAPQGTGRVLNGQGLQQVLSQAWDPMSDVGPQVAALHQLFGDALLPLIPGLP